ncbi:MAG: hypothetical protein ACE5IR_14330 [bacterium]
MMKTKRIGIFLTILWGCAGLANGQSRQTGPSDYLWPTEASKNLTSAFCEYRGRRFHAGIDIKTWGKVGYKVFAVRPGYVWRISVSPSGYGKALYIKLDTGEIAVYAHLSDYAKRILPYVEAEQKRLNKYSVNLFLKAGAVPVAQGEVVAYSGQTGIGAPHLHFEIRDASNRPLNPLSKGYKLPDRVRPIITKVSISPMDADSQVNGDFKPVIVRPKWIQPGEYIIEEPLFFWGQAGFAVSCYDKDSNSRNLFGVYSLKLFVDSVLRFRYEFDDLSFQQNKMIELERDYRLSRRSRGRFYKLYKEPHNKRSNYFPNKPWAGLLRSSTLVSEPNLETKEGVNRSQRGVPAGSLFPGLHDFEIETSDFFGNVSRVRGHIQVGASFDFMPLISEEEGFLNITDILTYDVTRVEKLEAFKLHKNRWQSVNLQRSQIESELLEKGGEEGPVTGLNPWSRPFTLRKPAGNPLIMKFVAKDKYNTFSYPYIYFETEPNEMSIPPELSIAYDYYDDYLRLEIKSKNLLPETPKAVLYPGRQDSAIIGLHQIDLKKYIGKIPYRLLKETYHLLKVSVRNLNGDPFSVWENFSTQKINPPKTTRLRSEDGRFWIDFWRGSVYRPLYGRIDADEQTYSYIPEIVSKVYDTNPQDVPLNTGAKVYFQYRDDEPNPEKLGVYYKTRRKWVMVDNDLNLQQKTVSAKVFSLEKFACFRDEEPPEITRIRPVYQAHLKTRTPVISFNVRDRLSGIAGEKDILVRLNGTKLITEYDPERRRVSYKIKEPLAKGRYELTVWIQDRSKNEANKESVFWID